MRPTGRAVLAFAVGIPASLAVVLANEDLWPFGLAVLAVAIVLTGMDGIRATPPGRIEIEVDPPAMLYMGSSDGLRITVTAAPGYAPMDIELLFDVGDNLDPPGPGRLYVEPGARVDATAPLTPLRRGPGVVDRLWLRWRGPMGLMRKQRVETLSLNIPIVPNVRAVRQAAIDFTAWDAQIGIKPQNQQGDGSEFDSLRDYVPGLDHRSIDWKRSARHRALVCKEFRAERNHQIIMAIDTGHLMNEPVAGVAKLDHAINNGLVLGYACLRHGDRVGVFGFDSRMRLFTEPVGGVHQFNHFLKASADLEYRPEETNFTLALSELLTRLKQRSLIILMTEFVDTTTAELMVENIERLAARHVVLFVTLRDPSLHDTVNARPRGLEDVTRSVIAADLDRERRVVFERLRRMGVHCLEAPSERVGTELVNRYLAIKRKELI